MWKNRIEHGWNEMREGNIYKITLKKKRRQQKREPKVKDKMRT